MNYAAAAAVPGIMSPIPLPAPEAPESCPLIEFAPLGARSEGRYAVKLGGVGVGVVAPFEGAYRAAGFSGRYVGASYREAAVAMVVAEAWMAIREPVLEAARRAAYENEIYCAGRVSA